MRPRPYLLTIAVAALAVASGAAVTRDADDSFPDVPVTAFTGWRGGVALGVALHVPGHPRATSYVVPEPPASLTVTVEASLQGVNCTPAPGADPPCPAVETARVGFTIAALLDARTPLELGVPELVLEARLGRTSTRSTVTAPVLVPGRHCLVVAVVERAAAVVAGQLPHHTNIAVFEIEVGGGTTDHCVAPPLLAEPWPAARDLVACGRPVISAEREFVRVCRAGHPGAFTAAIPVCDRTHALWMRDGRWLGVTGEPAGGRIDGNSPARADVRLGAGEWVLVVVHDVAGRFDSGASPPVVLR